MSRRIFDDPSGPRAPGRGAFTLDWNLPFAEALAYSQKRKVVLPDVYYGELQGVARSKAFSIAGVASSAQLGQVLDSLNKALGEGVSFADWKKRVRKGEIPLDLPDHRLDNIFRTNIQTAYSAGRWQSQKRNLATRPFLMYDAINDSRVRPAHLAMDGHIARADNPIWQKWYPPNGYRCRCTVIAISEFEARTRGYVDKVPPKDDPDPGWNYDLREDSLAGIREAIKGARVKIPKAAVVKLDEAVVVAESFNPNAWREVPGSQKGSNPGGEFIAPDGTRYYVKFPADIGQAKAEVAAAKIYEELGVETLKPDFVTIKGRAGIATKWREDISVKLKPDVYARNPDDVARIYQASVLTRNWDAVGLDLDNIGVDKAGRVVVMDTGGVFKYRAKGEIKPGGFSRDIDEAKTLLDPNINRKAASVFDPVLRADVYREKRVAEKLLELSDEKIEKILRGVGFSEADVADNLAALKARRDLLIDRYDLRGQYTPKWAQEIIDKLAERFGKTAFGGIASDPDGAIFSLDAFNEVPNIVRGWEEIYKAETGFDTRLVRNAFREWSGSSNGPAAAVVRRWAKDRFGVSISYHNSRTGAEADALTLAHERAFIEEQIKSSKGRAAGIDGIRRALDWEYALNQYYLRRLHRWDPIVARREMREGEYRSTYDQRREEWTPNAAQPVAIQQGVFTGDRRLMFRVRVEDVVKTWYQGGEYMRFGPAGNQVPAWDGDRLKNFSGSRVSESQNGSIEREYILIGRRKYKAKTYIRRDPNGAKKKP